MPKYKTIHYAKDCKNAKELIGDLIYYCPKISDQNTVIPFSKEDNKTLQDKWIRNKTTNEIHHIKEAKDEYVETFENSNITYQDLLNNYIFHSDKKQCGKIIEGKKIGCHSKVDCKYFIKK